jgi:hypothetical protein
MYKPDMNLVIGVKIIGILILKFHRNSISIGVLGTDLFSTSNFITPGIDSSFPASSKKILSS